MKKVTVKGYIESFLRIRTKDGNISPLILNEPQQAYYQAVRKAKTEGKPMRFIILKARQMGFSTLTEALIFTFVMWTKNTKALIVAHDMESSNNIFSMSRMFYDYLPNEIKPMVKLSNAKELVFENPSKSEEERKLNQGLRSQIRVATAGSESVGRGNTFNYVHISEYAFWTGRKEDTLVGILQAVPNTPDSLVVIESTAYGFDHFKKLWDDAVNGASGFTPLFFAWWQMETYRMTYDGTPLTKEEEKMKQDFNLDNDQIQWRRWCIRTNCGNDINKFRQEYPSTPQEAFIMSGRPVFDSERILARISEISLREYEKIRFDYTYSNEQIRGFEVVDGDVVKVYKRPIDGHPYVLSMDTAGEGSDFFACHVLDNTSGEQVAVLHYAGSNEIEVTRQVYCLGKWYNDALIGVEVNFGTYPILELQRLGYTNQYRREKVDTLREGTVSKFGWRTTSVTRPNMIAELKDVLDKEIGLINDVGTLNECLMFQKNDDGRPEAIQGEHDDLVMSLAIAYMIRGQQSFVVEQVIEEDDEEETNDGYESFLRFGRR